MPTEMRKTSVYFFDGSSEESRLLLVEGEGSVADSELLLAAADDMVRCRNDEERGRESEETRLVGEQSEKSEVRGVQLSKG